MTRADKGFRRQGREFLKAGVHLRRRTLEQAAAAAGHQAVGGKGKFAVGEVEGNVAEGVAGHVDDAHFFRPDGEAGSFVQGVVERRQAVGIDGGAEDHGGSRGAQRFHAGDVIIMVVGDQDIRQLPVPGGKRGKDRRGVGDVDDGGLARAGIVDKVGVVVGAAGDGHKFEGHGFRTGFGYDDQGLTAGKRIAMHLDVLDLRNFYYRTALGRVAQRAIRDEVVKHWAPGKGQTVVGFGFAVPLLRPYLPDARRVIGLMPGPQGVMPWPAGMENVSVLCEDTAWPVPTGLVDRLILMHGLETSENPSAVLEEAGRVLGPGGRAMVIVPNRTGLWARSDATPFGFGRPYSVAQLEAQMKRHGFTLERSQSVLFAPPASTRFWLRTANFWEAIGRKMPWLVGGVLMVEASKQVYAPTRGGLRAAVRKPLRVLEGIGQPASAPAPARG